MMIAGSASAPNLSSMCWFCIGTLMVVLLLYEHMWSGCWVLAGVWLRCLSQVMTWYILTTKSGMAVIQKFVWKLSKGNFANPDDNWLWWFVDSRIGDDLEVEDINPEQEIAPCWRYQMMSLRMKTEVCYWLEVGGHKWLKKRLIATPLTPTMNVWLSKFQGSEDPINMMAGSLIIIVQLCVGPKWWFMETCP